MGAAAVTAMPVKILVTVGTQFPFDRLIPMVDTWAAERPEKKDSVLMQTGPGGVQPQHTQYTEFLSPEEYRVAIESAEVLVAHAGIGSILTALESGLPVIIVPRRFDLGEHRNDHQSSTAREFSGRKGIYLALDEKTLKSLLDQSETLEKPENQDVDPRFLSKVSDFIMGQR